MKSTYSNSRKTLCALAVSAAIFGPVTAVAEEEQEALDSKGLERIEVTARKTVENLQEVPVAVTSIGAEELATNGIEVLTEVQQFSPNTTLQRSRGTNSTITAFIRGVGQQDPLWGYEPGVGIYVDDVYIARPQGAVLDLLDVERIEVLRGPQGTLYGKNTIGGAIKYVTKEMSGDAELNIQGTIGSYSQTDLKATGQFPIIDDMLYVGFGIASLQRDGFGEYLEIAPELGKQDKENYNKDVVAGRVTVEFRPIDDLFIRFNYDKTEDESNSKGGYRLLPSLLDPSAPVPDSVYDSYTSLPTWNKVELEGYSLTANWNFSDTTSIKYTFSDRDSYSPTNIDFDNTTQRNFDVPAIYDDQQTTHELQLNNVGDRHKLVAGLYYYDAESCGQFEAILEGLGAALGPAFGIPDLVNGGFASSVTREVSGCSNGKSQAAYAQLSYDFTDSLSVTAGGRYTKDEKRATVNNGLVWDTVYPESGWVEGYQRPSDSDPVLPVGFPVPSVLDDSEDWSKFTPRIGVEYQANDDMMFFASFAQGFKSGTFNPRATFAEPAADPEDVDSYEIGMKAEWFENSLRTNITAFSLDHKDRQYVSALPVESGVDLNQILANVGSSESQGIEAEISYQVMEDLRFDVAFGYIDTEFNEVVGYEEDTNGEIVQIDLSDRYTVANTPKYTFNFAANYTLETGIGDFIFNGNYYYRDDYGINEIDNLLSQDGYGLLNFSVNWFSNDGNWYAGLHAKNLTDEEYLVGGYQFVTVDENGDYVPGTGGDNTLIGYYGDPQTVSLTVGYQF
ncbi:TonB-dependent receptor [Thalassotalea sp. PS06]|uniref:TonB-dependent receptor n=1 Tax=Thalassotalea sp. PS06 TaxID=2594005 RepID=UPI00116388B3|nr:TonB-dependent receptor [Thalassotalea sp. PS06]QDP00563.1 TonB-dependent receptor [Thalassotalea sp. PS06]